jgi:hypothetical protein
MLIVKLNINYNTCFFKIYVFTHQLLSPCCVSSENSLAMWPREVIPNSFIGGGMPNRWNESFVLYMECWYWYSCWPESTGWYPASGCSGSLDPDLLFLDKSEIRVRRECDTKRFSNYNNYIQGKHNFNFQLVGRNMANKITRMNMELVSMPKATCNLNHHRRLS